MNFKRRVIYYLIRLLRINASPRKVAASLTLGFIPSWIPTFGLGPILSVGIVKVFRGNILAAVIGGIIGTPIWPLLFFLNYQVGELVLRTNSSIDTLDEVEYLDVGNQTLWSIKAGSMLFFTGSMINIIIFSILSYLLTYFLIKRYRALIVKKLRNSLGKSS